MKKLFFTLLLCSTTATLHAQHLEPAAAADDDQASQLVFSYEFDQPDGSAPDPDKWRCSTRYSATWCRWISDSPEVAYIKNGRLVCRAIPNPDTTRDNVPMITGAVETQHRFSFTYGKVEVRVRTNIQNGNFPAAWMMPQPPCDGWPRGGEIDIFESIDNQQRAYHTVHSHWTYDLGHKSDPQHSFSESVKVNEWHVYGLIWTETELRWTLDGNVVATYPKSTDASALQQGQWPFDHPFYSILNQSVGDGSWAKAANTSQTYTTFFDYVRVYQRVPDRITSLPADTPTSQNPSRTINPSPSTLNHKPFTLHQSFSLSGHPVSPTASPRGLFVYQGRKILLR